MRINSAESLATGSRIFARYGSSWEKVREASRYVNGVYVIERSPEEVGVPPSATQDDRD